MLVAAGKTSEARAVASVAASRAPDELQGQIAVADVELSEKRPGLAIARLARALAARLPEVPLRFEAELLLARSRAAAGKTDEMQAGLRALATEARQRASCWWRRPRWKAAELLKAGATCRSGRRPSCGPR